MNKQNLFIKDRLAHLNMTINILHALHLTVLDFEVKDRNPVIHIAPGKGCQQLRDTRTVWKPADSGIRKVTKVAKVGDCEVRWDVQEDIPFQGASTC
ncbi:MAG: hypothetical protein ACRBB6_02920 [Neptuniibacter sp.]